MVRQWTRKRATRLNVTPNFRTTQTTTAWAAAMTAVRNTSWQVWTCRHTNNLQNCPTVPLLFLGLAEVLDKVASTMEEASETPGPSTVAKAAPRPKAGGQAKAPTQGGVGRGLGRPGATRTPGVSAVGPRPSTNRSGPSTMRNPPGQKTLQVGDKKADSVVHKKSMEKRLGVKESQKKPSRSL